MRRILTIFILITFSIISISADAGRSRKLKKFKEADAIKSESGLNIPEWGIAIDASYDPRLDDLIPGYRILNIAITNRRPNNIILNPKYDKWTIIDNAGKKHTAYNHVKYFSRKTWKKLSDDFKAKLDYPKFVKPGNMTVVDVFLPKTVDLFQFRQIIWESKFFDKQFSIYTQYEKTLAINEDDFDKNIPIPLNEQKDRNAIKDYIKTRDQILNPNKHKAKQTKYDKQDEELAKDKTAPRDSLKKDNLNFDPSFDDAIIVR